MQCKFCGKRTSWDSSVGKRSLIVCNNCVNSLTNTAKDICNTCPDTAFEIIITMLINKCGEVCDNEIAIRDKGIDRRIIPIFLYLKYKGIFGIVLFNLNKLKSLSKPENSIISISLLVIFGISE